MCPVLFVLPFLIPTSPAVATPTSQSPHASVNAAADSTDSQNGYAANVGFQQSFGDANGGHMQHLYEHVGYYEAEVTLSGSAVENSMQLETDSCSHDEALHLTNTDWVTALQTEVSVQPETDKITSDGKCPESGIPLGSDNACDTMGASEGKDAGIEQDTDILRESAESSCLKIQFDNATQEKSSEDGNTCAVEPGSFVVHDLTASIPENNSPLLALHEKSGNELEELDSSLPSNTASKMESVSHIIATDDVSTLNGSMSQSSKLHLIDALANIIADARNNKVLVVSVSIFLVQFYKESNATVMYFLK